MIVFTFFKSSRLNIIRILNLVFIVLFSALAFGGPLVPQKAQQAQYRVTPPSGLESSCQNSLADASEAWLDYVIRSGNLTPALANNVLDSTDQQFRKILNRIVEYAKVSDKPSFDRLIWPLEDLIQSYMRVVEPILFVSENSSDPELSNQTRDFKSALGKSLDLVFSNEPLYNALIRLHPRDSIKKKLLTVYLKAFEQHGLSHPDPKVRVQVSQLIEESRDMGEKFYENLEQNDLKIVFTAGELEGVSDKELSLTGDLFHFKPSDVSHLITILTKAKSADARRKAYLAARQRSPENLELLKQTLVVRNKIATTLKNAQATWLNLQIDEDTLAVSPNQVQKMLDMLRQAYQESTQDILDKMKLLKQAEEGTQEPLRPWDIHYYSAKVQEIKPVGSSEISTDFDLHSISEFLPALPTLRKMLSRIGELLNLEFREERDFVGYAPGVFTFQVSDGKSGRNLGRVLMDIGVRDGKDSSYNYAGYMAPPSGLQQGNQPPLLIVRLNLAPPESPS